jgi:hypothetical protein
MSLIKFDENWILFSNTEISESQIKEMTFGSSTSFDDSDIGVSAYLLFYIKLDSSVAVGDQLLRFDTVPSLADQVGTVLRQEIAKANTEYIQLQAAFSESMTSFVASLNDVETVLKYFLNVFCHLSLSGSVPVMIQALRRMISSETSSLVLDFCQKHAWSIWKVFLHCGNQSVIAGFSKFIKRVLDLEEAFPVLEIVFKILPAALASNWAHIPNVSHCVLYGIEEYPACLEQAMAAGWTESLISFVNSVYETPRSQVIFQNINRPDTFRLLVVFLEKNKKPPFQSILKFNASILQSTAHSKEFLDFVKLLWVHRIIDFMMFLQSVSQSKSDTSSSVYDELIEVLVVTDDQAEVKSLLDTVPARRKSADSSPA